MHCVQKIVEDIYWIGGNDRRLEKFENLFPIPEGVSYNSTLIIDEKTAIIDTVDSSIRNLYLENIKFLLKDRKLDYLIVNHMEPDHCGNIEELVKIYPNLKIIGNKKTFAYFEQFYNTEMKENYLEIKEGDILDLGKHKLQIISTPLVHWPEVTMTFEVTKKILFSADAFGTFGAINGNIFRDEIDYNRENLAEERRYYSNIIGKFGAQVQMALKKIKALNPEMIVSLHGPIWREKKEVELILSLYDKWSSYIAEKQGVLLVYGSMYGNTENIVNCLANKLAQRGIRDIKICDVSKVHPSYIVGEIWKYSHIVFAAPTYNTGLYFPMSVLLQELSMLNIQNRKISLIGNYTWASAGLKTLKDMIEKNFKKVDIVGEVLDIKSTLKMEEEIKIDELSENIVKSLLENS